MVLFVFGDALVLQIVGTDYSDGRSLRLELLLLLICIRWGSLSLSVGRGTTEEVQRLRLWLISVISFVELLLIL